MSFSPEGVQVKSQIFCRQADISVTCLNYFEYKRIILDRLKEDSGIYVATLLIILKYLKFEK